MLFASAFVMIGVVLLLVGRESLPHAATGVQADPIHLYCDDVHRAAIEAVRERYQRESHQLIKIHYGDSQTLLADIKAGSTADLFLPANDSVAEPALINGSLAEVLPLATLLHGSPAVHPGEPRGVTAVPTQLSIAVVATTARPSAVLHFARYVAARDRGLIHFAHHGYQVVQGDVWEDTPELSFFIGAMLRPAVDDTITAFEQREGVRVWRVYNGCGILVAQMKAGQHPDAYFACDTEFMKQVPDLFPESVELSQNELVILVQKGNPHDIRSLKDLARKGLRIGIGHEKQCAMGWLTQNTFREAGMQQQIMENVAVQTPTGDMLVNQLQTASLDAAVAYLSNAAGAGDFLDAIQIHGIPCSVASQPLAISPNSPRAQTASRLFQWLCSADSQASFAAEGFRWQHHPPSPSGKATEARQL
jgi:molybdate transport system substrate-binding protein